MFRKKVSFLYSKQQMERFIMKKPKNLIVFDYICLGRKSLFEDKNRIYRFGLIFPYGSKG